MSEPADQRERDRFAHELESNFSVVAAAGSGKTTALVQRIGAIAQSGHARDWLPRLVVVTYTNRAANDMQQRTRAEILKARPSVDVLSAFNRAFFGTIHSFCVRLLETQGHFLGLPPHLDLVTDDDELWNDFVQRQEVIGRGLTNEARAILLRHVEARRLLPLGRRGGVSADAAFTNEPCPAVNIDALLRYEPKGNSIDNIIRTQEHLRGWQRAQTGGAEFFPLPLRGSTAKAWIPLWDEAFGPFREWLSRAALCVAAELERDYRAYRLTKGTLTYNDQIALALQLFDHPEAARRIRNQQYRVILDEAQDTGPAQFGVLLEAARPPEASGRWPNETNNPPQPGHFCMVGDFQQSIFSQHADLPFYKQVHHALINAPGGETVEFSVSFRLDETGIKFLNETFSRILDETEDQVRFVPMQARPNVLPGQILRLEFSAHDFPPRTPVRRKAAWEARELARWIRSTGLKKLRAETWRDVAILCPRKLWFGPLRDALTREGLEVEVQSETAIKGDNPAYAWLTALLTVLVDPGETYETVGVLREIFGLSDHELAAFARRQGGRFDFSRTLEGDDAVAQKLRWLSDLRVAISARPLFSAVQEAIERVQLRARLQSLPPEDFENLADELDALLASAARAEAEGMRLHDFARYLRDDFLSTREAPAAGRASAIQLITSHKAKGSEWQAVIVPFLMREVDSRTDNFPRLTTDRARRIQRILFDKEEVTKEMEAEVERIQRQEMERLLYVALTRARHTLVLASAPRLYATTQNPQPSKSQIKWLRCEDGGCNQGAFSSLGDEAQTEDETAAHQKTKTAERARAARVPALPVPKAGAVQFASNFVHKISPSGLAEAFSAERAAGNEQPEGIPFRAGAFDNEATRYGHWWHQLTQKLDWRQTPAQWEPVFQSSLIALSDRVHAEREWKLFLEHLLSKSDFRKRLGAEPFVPHAEFPFVLKMGPTAALEGVIDLALLALDSRRALIVDWKTNRIAVKNIDTLRGKYRSQLAAYWQAVRQLTGFEVEAALYSTATGSLLMYDATELETEWALLATLPPEQMRGEIDPGER
ncbi:MAG TPA: UvrD-helicase domain-containing protein [Chthoniobacterales bacterium]|nr:UvrD-helicase domain-containing protein [Chthoniobacterales bacterium]